MLICPKTQEHQSPCVDLWAHRVPENGHQPLGRGNSLWRSACPILWFSRLCNNINDFLFRAKLCYIKLVKRGYMHNLLYEYFKKFCLTYKIEEIYGERDHDLFFSRMIEHNPSISCNINNVTDINDIVKACSVIITKLPSNSKDTCINNPPLSTSVIVENTSISRISNTDIDNTEEPGSYDLRDIAKCSTIPCENIPPSAPTGDEQ